MKIFCALIALAIAAFAAGTAEAETKALGALSPEAAFEYMKKAENLLIVDTATEGRFMDKTFAGAVNIPVEELGSDELDAKIEALPGGRPVMLHCRLGMVVPRVYDRLLALRPDVPEAAYIDGRPPFDEYNEWLASRKNNAAERRLLGGISPEAAIEYIKSRPSLVIVEVNSPEWKMREGIAGAMHIPYKEMAARCGEIPSGRPVLLYCGGGIVSVEAYETLCEKRPDIPELGYIAGAPLVREYNKGRQEK